jgi:hypothetical protein
MGRGLFRICLELHANVEMSESSMLVRSCSTQLKLKDEKAGGLAVVAIDICTMDNIFLAYGNAESRRFVFVEGVEQLLACGSCQAGVWDKVDMEIILQQI